MFDFGEDVLWFLFPVNERVYIATFPRVRFIEFYRAGDGELAQFYWRLAQAVTADLERLRAQALLRLTPGPHLRAHTLSAAGAWRDANAIGGVFKRCYDGEVTLPCGMFNVGSRQ